MSGRGPRFSHVMIKHRIRPHSGWKSVKLASIVLEGVSEHDRVRRVNVPVNKGVGEACFWWELV